MEYIIYLLLYDLLTKFLLSLAHLYIVYEFLAMCHDHIPIKQKTKQCVDHRRLKKNIQTHSQYLLEVLPPYKVTSVFRLVSYNFFNVEVFLKKIVKCQVFVGIQESSVSVLL